VTSTGVVLEGVAPPVELMTCSITPTPPRDTVSIIGGWAGLLLGERLLPAIRAAAREHSLRYPLAQTSIELGRLGPDAVALGAATLPIEALLSGTAFTAKKSDRPAS